MSLATFLVVILAGLVLIAVYLIWRVASAYEDIGRLRRRIRSMEGEEDR